MVAVGHRHAIVVTGALVGERRPDVAGAHVGVVEAMALE
jgi:hypothetical protein